MKKLIPILGLAIVLQACTFAKFDTSTSSMPVMLTEAPANARTVDDVWVEKRYTFDWTNHHDVADLIYKADVPANADALANARLVSYHDEMDVVYNLLTLFIANSHTVRLEADAVDTQ